ERDEERRVEHGDLERSGQPIAAVAGAQDVERHEDDRAEDERALRRPPPRGWRRNAYRPPAALLSRLRLGLGLGAVTLLGRRRDELFGRLVELVPLGVDPDGLVLVPAFLLCPAPLLPRGHGRASVARPRRPPRRRRGH